MNESECVEVLNVKCELMRIYADGRREECECVAASTAHKHRHKHSMRILLADMQDHPEDVLVLMCVQDQCFCYMITNNTPILQVPTKGMEMEMGMVSYILPGQHNEEFQYGLMLQRHDVDDKDRQKLHELFVEFAMLRVAQVSPPKGCHHHHHHHHHHLHPHP